MHVEIAGQSYRLSNDYCVDLGQSWAWDNEPPTCPACGDTFTIRDGSRLVDVEAVALDTWRVVCACGFTKEMH